MNTTRVALMASVIFAIEALLIVIMLWAFLVVVIVLAIEWLFERFVRSPDGLEKMPLDTRERNP